MFTLFLSFGDYDSFIQLNIHEDTFEVLLNFLEDDLFLLLFYNKLSDFFLCRDMECSRDASIPSYSSLFDPGKQTEIDNTAQADNMRQEGTLNELSSIDCLKLQLSEQYPLHPYSNANFSKCGKNKA